MKPQKVTLNDIAREADVSAQTVSRVINDRPDVSRATRKKVQEVIDRLGYFPNAVARSLSSKRTWMIGVVISSVDRYGPNKIFSELDKYAHQSGYRLLPYITHDEDDINIQKHMRELLAHQPDGIIWAAMERQGHETLLNEDIVQTPVPFVTMEATIPNVCKPAFMEQTIPSMQLVLHLIEQGYRNIGIITGERLATRRGRLRIDGWRNALESAGIPVSDRQMTHGDWSAEGGERAMAQLKQQYPEVDAVFATNDQMALGVLSYAHQHNISVPDELGVVGFDDIAEAKCFAPPLTTARQPFEAFCSRTIEILAHMIEAHFEELEFTYPEMTTFYPEIIIRGSSVPTRH